MNVEATGRSIDAVNNILQNITTQSIDFEKKMVKTNAQMALSASLPGIGQNLDVQG
ncbi:MAG: hypothetical protein GX640_07630 [Fibrobacter sp.]|nr:hypothetical protein [Fibrobacter sp.]